MALLYVVVLLVYVFDSTVNAGAIKSTGNDLGDEGYYWRDYTGKIPKDAFPGGKNLNGHTTYIGQVLYLNLLIPAKIDPEEGKVYFEWGYQEYEATENIKILCTKHPEIFEWVTTGNGFLNKIKDKNFVVGGYEPAYTILIGRRQIGNELVIGKIFSNEAVSILNTTKNGKTIQHNEYEVLCYDTARKINKKKGDKKDERISIIDLIDVRHGNSGENETGTVWQ